MSNVYYKNSNIDHQKYQSFIHKSNKMNSRILIIACIAIYGVYAEPPTRFNQQQRQFRPLSGRLTNGLGRQQSAPENNSPAAEGYNYPKPEYGVPEESSPPAVQEAAAPVKFVVAPAPVPVPQRIVRYFGAPEKQVYFEKELIHYPTHDHIKYNPYTVDVVPVREEVLPVREEAYSIEVVEHFS